MPREGEVRNRTVTITVPSLAAVPAGDGKTRSRAEDTGHEVAPFIRVSRLHSRIAAATSGHGRDPSAASEVAMSPSQWLWMAAALLVLVAVAGLDHRYRRNKRRQINEALTQKRCAACGGEFTRWRGQQSRNHYTFMNGADVEDVIELSCVACGRHMDAFWCLDGRLEVSEPW